MRRRSVTTGWWAVEEGHWLAGAGAAEEGHSTDTNPCQISRNVTVVSKLNSDVVIQFSISNPIKYKFFFDFIIFT